MLKVGLIGAGYMMQTVHLPALRALAEAEPVAIADLDRELAARVAQAYGIPRVYASAAELVEGEPALDAVVVVTAKEHHAQAALPALERGIPTLVEKPLAADVETGRRMVEAAERHGALLMVGYMKRFDPAVQSLQEHLAQGTLGTVRYVHVHDFGGNWTAGALRLGGLSLTAPPPDEPRRARAQGVGTSAEEAFREWIEVWIHDVNLVRALFGSPQAILRAHPGLPRLTLLECRGIPVLLEVGPLAHPNASWDEWLLVYGSQGRAEIVFPPPLLLRQPARLTLWTAAGTVRPSLPYREAFFEQMRHFLRCVRDQTPPLVSAREALADLELCQAITQVAYGASIRRP